MSSNIPMLRSGASMAIGKACQREGILFQLIPLVVLESVHPERGKVLQSISSS